MMTSLYNMNLNCLQHLLRFKTKWKTYLTLHLSFDRRGKFGRNELTILYLRTTSRSQLIKGLKQSFWKVGKINLSLYAN